MWNDRKSLIFSKVCVLLFLLTLVVCAILAPGEYGTMLPLLFEGRKALFLTTIYLGCIPAVVLLVLLFAILSRLGSGQVFVRKNVQCLRYISWCCFSGAIISAVSMLYWIPWGAVSVAAAFMGLIVRVIKNIIAKAVSLQDEADFTI